MNVYICTDRVRVTDTNLRAHIWIDNLRTNIRTLLFLLVKTIKQRITLCHHVNIYIETTS